MNGLEVCCCHICSINCNRDYIINKLDLSEERVAYYEENIEEACYQKPVAYDYLIELQNNGGKSQ